MFCGKCGNEIPEESLYCPFCGSRTINNPEQVSTAGTENEIRPAASAAAQSEAGVLPWPLVALGLVTFMIIAGIIIGQSNGTLTGGDDVFYDDSQIYENFNIEGKWKNVGETTFGQVDEGAIVIFDGEHCNVYSPADTYAFYLDGDTYRLDLVSAVFGEDLTFYVYVTDENNIEIDIGDGEYLELTRVENI